MSYVKFGPFTDVPQDQWGSPPAGAKALSAAVLNHMEDGIFGAAALPADDDAKEQYVPTRLSGTVLGLEFARANGWIVGTDPQHGGAVADWAGGASGTDNTASIQQGLNDAAAAGTVYYLPAGAYRIAGQLNLPAYTQMVGAGWSALCQDVYGGAQWLAPVAGQYGGTLLVCSATSGSAVYGDAAAARWSIRDLALIGPGTGTTVGLNLSATGGFTIRPHLSNLGLLNFAVGCKVGASNEGLYDSLTAYACAAGFSFGPLWNANTVLNIECQKTTGEGIVVDGVSNDFSGGIVQGCSGTSGLRVAKDGNAFHGFYLENVTAAQAVNFQAGGTFNGYFASTGGGIFVNGSGVVLSKVYAPSATVTIAAGIVGTVLLMCSVSAVSVPAGVQVHDIGSLDHSGLGSGKVNVLSGALVKWSQSVGGSGELVLTDVANARKAAALYPGGASNLAALIFYGVITIGSSATSGRPNAGNFSPGSQWFDTTLNKPIWISSSHVWVDATGAAV